jgi:tetratricopeptide (TPR) repeat protein
MAKIAHPNVVAVHEIDVVGGRVAIVMERVRGRTLRAFLQEAPQKRRAIVDVFVQAGRGLAEVHRAGLVHRDFKPENVLVSDAGRVCVTDFGLVSFTGGAPAEGNGSGRVDPDLSLTQSNTILGTPLYMAPEQHRGEPADARTDQFAFCASLYEALYGEMPFAWKTYVELRDNVLSGRVLPPPRGARVPARLRAILLRGLATRREDRYPSMGALVAELEKDARRAPARWLGVALLAAIAALAAVLFVALRPRAPLCKGGEERLAGIWDQDVKARMKSALLVTDRPYAQDTFERVQKILDDKASAWVAMYTDSCEATNMRGEQSAQLLDLRTRCLDRRRAELGALTGLLSKSPDADVVAKAIEASLALPGVDRCADSESLTAVVSLPNDAATRAKIDAVQARIEEANAWLRVGKHVEGLAIATAAAADAGALGYAPVHANALCALGRLQRDAGDFKAAEPTLRDAADAAAKARDDRLLASVWTDLIDVTGVRLSRYTDALALEPVASAAIERGGGDSVLRAKLLGTVADMLHHKGESRAGLEKADRAIELYQKAQGPDGVELPALLNIRGHCLVGLERYPEAESSYEQALAAEEKIFGSDHPVIALVTNDLGGLFGRRGQHEKALPYLQRSVKILEKTKGPEHPSLGSPLNSLGLVLWGLGRLDEALESLKRALSIFTTTLGPDNPNVAKAQNNIAGILFVQEKYAEAAVYYGQTLAAKEKKFGPDHAEVAVALSNVGITLVAQGKPEEGRPLLERAVAIHEKTSGPASLAVAQALQLLGDCYLDMKEANKALPILSRALSIQQKNERDADPTIVADTELTLARALWETGGDRTRAVKMAGEARAAYQAAGATYKKQAERAKAWLEARGR